MNLWWMKHHFNSDLCLKMDLFMLPNWGVRNQPVKPVEGEIMLCLATNNRAPFSLVNASCFSNGPIKGNHPWSSLGMSHIDYLTMSKLCSQITDNTYCVCAHVCPGPKWANKRPFSHLFRLKSAHAKERMEGNESREGDQGGNKEHNGLVICLFHHFLRLFSVSAQLTLNP